MNIILNIVNTTLLVILFFYQRNKNQVLEDRLIAQGKLIDETNSVVKQQSMAIEGQSKVVDSALKYSSAFDVNKIENLLRREINFEHRTFIENLTKQFEKIASETQAQYEQQFEEYIDKITDIISKEATKVAMDLIKSMLPHVIKSMLLLQGEARSNALELLHSGIRTVVASAIKRVESEP